MLITILLIFSLFVKFGEASPRGDYGKNKPNILMITDNTLFSHFQLAVYLANNLQRDGNQVVLFVEEHHGIKDRNLLQIHIDDGVEVELRPYDKEFKASFDTDTSKTYSDWTKVLYSSNQQKYWDLIAYRAVSQYYELAQRECNRDLMEKWRKINFDLGIAENRDLGAFAIFHELGIKKTISTTATPGVPAFMHFLGLPLALTVPEHFSARPGDCATENCIQNTERQLKNEWRYRMSVHKFEQIYAEIHRQFYVQKFGKNTMPTLPELFRKSVLFFSNATEAASIPRPMLKKIKFMGGIATNLELYRKKWTHPPMPKSDKCIVLFSLGSLVTFDNTPEHILRAMIDAFGQFGKESKCQVVAKIPLVELAKFYAIDYAENVLKIREIANPDLFKLDPEEDLFSNMHSISDDQRTKFPNNVYPISWVRQQEFIASHDVRALIVHCGQNSLNEAFYAGVPVICMPFFGDQHFNSATVEYHKLGVWLQPSGVSKINMLQALHRLFEPSNKFHENAQKLALKLMDQFGSPGKTFSHLVAQINGEINLENDDEVIGKDRVPGASQTGQFPYVDFTKQNE